MDPVLRRRCKTTITWYRLIGTDPDTSDKKFENCGEVPVYQFTKNKTVVSREGTFTKSEEHFIVDLTVHPISVDDSIEYLGKRYQIDQMRRYHHPLKSNQMEGEIIC